MGIVNVVSAAPSPLDILKNAPFDIYSGGSRRMAQLAGIWVNGEQPLSADDQQYKITITSSTDYDFYATYHPTVETYLREAGFTDTSHSLDCADGGYDLDTEAVMILERDNVQIVLRKDAVFYQKVFESIPVHFYYKYLWKSSPVCVGQQHIQPIFNALFAVAHATEK